MKKYILDFLHRGIIASVGGPIILAIIYAVLYANGIVDMLSTIEVVKGIITSAILAFIAGGINFVYNIERLQTAPAALIHFAVLYLDYILIYLFNGWIVNSLDVIIIFTSIFALGFALIWLIIYLTTRKKIKKMNKSLAK